MDLNIHIRSSYLNIVVLKKEITRYDTVKIRRITEDR